MITYELLAKLRLENVRLLTRMEHLQRQADREGSSALVHELSIARGELRDYVGLVDAVVDALMPDAPRPRRLASNG